MKIFNYVFIVFGIMGFGIGSISFASTGEINDTFSSVTSSNLSPSEFLQKYLDTNTEKNSMNKALISAIQENLSSYTNSKQKEILDTFVGKLRTYTTVLTVLHIDKKSLLIVLEYTLQLDKKNSNSTTQYSLVASHGDIIKYDLYDYKEDGKKVFVFKLDSPKQVRRATRHRPDGSTYTCEMEQCKQIPKVRRTDESHEVVVYINYGYGETSREVMNIDL